MLKALPLHYGCCRMTIRRQTARPDSNRGCWTRRRSWTPRRTPSDSCSTVARTVSQWTSSRATIPNVQ